MTNPTSNNFNIAIAEQAATPAYLSGMVNYEVKYITSFNGLDTVTQAINAHETGWLTGSLTYGNQGIMGRTWSGGAGKPSAHKLYMLGGGHADSSAFNGIIELDFEGGAAPNGFSYVSGSATPLATVPPYDSVSSPTPVYQQYPDGKPSARHTYYGVAYDDTANAIILTGGAAWQGGGSNKDVWRFDLDTQTWTLAVFPYSAYGINIYNNVMWDSDTQKGFITTRGSYEGIFYRGATNNVSGAKALGGFSTDNQYYPTVYDSRRKRGYPLTSEFGYHYYQLDFSAETLSRQSWAGPSNSAILVSTCTWYFDRHPTDPSLDRFWVFGGYPGSVANEVIYEMNATTFVVTTHTLTGDDLETGMAGDANGFFGRSVWMPDYQAVGTATSMNGGAFVIKLPLYQS